MKKVKAKNNKTKVSEQNQNLKMAITVKNLVIKYRDIKKFSLRKDLFKAKKATTFTAVNDVSFEIPKGQIVGICGKNGSGKSTLLRAIAGIFSADSGTIDLHHNSVSLLSIGVGFQRKLTGYDNIFLSGMLLGFNEEQIKETLISKWKKNLNKEMQQGMTLTGLHRDDLIFLVDGKDARTFASQGQQRLIVIAYKIAELLVFKKIKGEYPVLLLDDVFSEIDIKRRNNIIKYLKQDMQVIITTTDLLDINDDLVNSAKVFSIKNGKITKKGGVKNARRKNKN